MECLPSISSCCYCVPLKAGSIIIAILGILNAFSIGVIFSENDSGNTMSETLDILKHVVVGVQVALFVASLLLLVGIYMDVPVLILVWVVVALAAVIVAIIYAILASPLFYDSLEKESSTWAKTGTFLITPLIWLYCIIVVNSYVLQG